MRRESQMKQVRLKAWKNSPRNYLTTKFPVKADGSKVVYIIAFIRGIVLYRQHIGKRITNLLHREVYYVKPTGKLFHDPFVFPRNYWPKQIFEEYTIFFSVHNLTLSNISNGYLEYLEWRLSLCTSKRKTGKSKETTGFQ